MCLWSHPFYLSFGQHFSCCCHLYMCRLFATVRGFLHVLTTKLSMMKSCLAIFWMDFSATNAFFSSVERILFILDLRLEKRADFHYSLSARKKTHFQSLTNFWPIFFDKHRLCQASEEQVLVVGPTECPCMVYLHFTIKCSTGIYMCVCSGIQS